MDFQTVFRHKFRNLLHTLLLMLGMALLLGFSSTLLFGEASWPWVFGAVAIVMLIMPEVSPRWILTVQQARRVLPQEAPRLHALLRDIAQRAGLPNPPALYWTPSASLNAFALGRREQSAIAISDGLLRRLSFRELAGVLAHEVSHIANNDMRLLNLAGLLSRLTYGLAIAGLILVVASLPLLLMGHAPISPLGLLLLVLAPHLSALLQLALSRTREFDADLQAARITADPEGLASALNTIEQGQNGFWQRLLWPSYRDASCSLLRTHPNTRERIQRLLELKTRPFVFPTIKLYSDHFHF